MLDPVEEAFDPIALLVKRFGKAVLFLAVRLVGDVRRRALCFDLPAQPIGVIGFVAEQHITFAQANQQFSGADQVMGLTRRQDNLDRQAARIGERVDLGRQPTSGAAKTISP